MLFVSCSPTPSTGWPTMPSSAGIRRLSPGFFGFAVKDRGEFAVELAYL